MGERVAIVGNHKDVPEHVLANVRLYIDALPADDVVVTGDAIGVDLMAWTHSGKTGRKRKRHLAKWDEQGKRAGPIRNAKVVADCDRMVAFWDGVSDGTRDAIRQAHAAGKPVEIVRWSHDTT